VKWKITVSIRMIELSAEIGCPMCMRGMLDFDCLMTRVMVVPDTETSAQIL
jgi:hypothetical protein